MVGQPKTFRNYKMEKRMSKKLSICIPTYNRSDVLIYVLESISQQISGYEAEVEICVSDNASSDETQRLISKYTHTLPLKYHRMPETVHPLKNWDYTVTHMALGSFVLIMGDDDILVNDGVRRLIKLIDEHQDIDYVYLNHTHRQIEQLKDIVFNNKCQCNIKQAECECYCTKDKYVNKWEEILNYEGKFREVNMLYIGNHLFRRSIWHMPDIENDFIQDELKECNLEYFYKVWSPQVTIFAEAMMGKRCFYSGNPIIVQGLGPNISMVDNKQDLYFLTFIGRWRKLFIENGIDKDIYKEYTAFMNRYVIKRLYTVIKNKRNAIEENSFIQNYIYDYIKDKDFICDMYDVFSDPGNNFFLNAAMSETRKNIKKIINNKNGLVVLWGTGDVAKNYMQYLCEISEKITTVVDGNIRKHDQLYELSGEIKLLIESPEVLKDRNIALILIGTVKHEESVIRFIEENISDKTWVFCSKGLICVKGN